MKHNADLIINWHDGSEYSKTPCNIDDDGQLQTLDASYDLVDYLDTKYGGDEESAERENELCEFFEAVEARMVYEHEQFTAFVLKTETDEDDYDYWTFNNWNIWPKDGGYVDITDGCILVEAWAVIEDVIEMVKNVNGVHHASNK